jgi:hypothetical protein
MFCQYVLESFDSIGQYADYLMKQEIWYFWWDWADGPDGASDY